MADHKYEFDVVMTCSGCSGAVNRVLAKLDGVKSYDVSLETQKATVLTEPNVELETVFDKINKTGKKIQKQYADGVEVPLPVKVEG